MENPANKSYPGYDDSTHDLSRRVKIIRLKSLRNEIPG